RWEREPPAGGTGRVRVTAARVATAERPSSDGAVTVRGPPSTIAAAKRGWFSSSASAARKKYLEFTPAHSNGPSRILRSLGLSAWKSVLCVFAALVTTA